MRLESGARPAPGPTAAAVGNFDGVHRGHVALVEEASAIARARQCTPLVVTFDPHPSRVLGPDRAPSTLMTPEQKAEALAAAGIELVAVVPFTLELAGLSPARFAEGVLVGQLGVSAVIVGEHFRFGHRRAGNLARLRELGAELGFEVRGVPPVLHEGLPISSTRIREAVARGDVQSAARMLGRPYFVDGRVGAGEGRGRRLGVPTANLVPENELLPSRGVYAGWCRVGGRRWPAVVNVGHRPTFGSGELVLEAHLLGFEGDVYGERVRVELWERLRDELRFPGPSALKEQIERDRERARSILAGVAL